MSFFCFDTNLKLFRPLIEIPTVPRGILVSLMTNLWGLKKGPLKLTTISDQGVEVSATGRWIFSCYKIRYISLKPVCCSLGFVTKGRIQDVPNFSLKECGVQIFDNRFKNSSFIDLCSDFYPNFEEMKIYHPLFGGSPLKLDDWLASYWEKVF